MMEEEERLANKSCSGYFWSAFTVPHASEEKGKLGMKEESEYKSCYGYFGYFCSTSTVPCAMDEEDGRGVSCLISFYCAPYCSALLCEFIGVLKISSLTCLNLFRLIEDFELPCCYLLFCCLNCPQAFWDWGMYRIQKYFSAQQTKSGGNAMPTFWRLHCVLGEYCAVWNGGT